MKISSINELIRIFTGEGTVSTSTYGCLIALNEIKKRFGNCRIFVLDEMLDSIRPNAKIFKQLENEFLDVGLLPFKLNNETCFTAFVKSFYTKASHENSKQN
jgi:hypothetical protein